MAVLVTLRTARSCNSITLSDVSLVSTPVFARKVYLTPLAETAISCALITVVEICTVFGVYWMVVVAGEVVGDGAAPALGTAAAQTVRIATAIPMSRRV